jgi:hypothetical protein
MIELDVVHDDKGLPYHHARIVGNDGAYEDWLLTASEVARIRERSANKGGVIAYLPAVPAMPAVPAWKRFMLRWLGEGSL